MTSEKGKREVPIQNIPAESEEPEEGAGRFIRSLIQAGVSLATIPIHLLPEESQGYVADAGREVALGLAAFTREVAGILEEMGQEPESEA